MKSIVLATSLALFASIQGQDCDFSFNYIDCDKLSNYDDCMNAVNDDVFDGSKCFPLTGSDCATWSDVSGGGYSIDFGTNQGRLSSSEKAQIEEMKWVALWGQYPYDASMSNPKLQDMKIIEDKIMGTLAVVGFDGATNSIIVSFRGSSNI
mmetsp:Transcript_39769/g.29349  ORF Transcript_39769/g.29349 Transcript_39769/m.29349 type:complete len:151 (+) Transcript_39769:15-467(+)